MNWLTPCPECFNQGSPRMNFQWWAVVRAQGNVLNVGSADDPLGFGSRCTHFDYDDWSAHFGEKGLSFVQGDAHELGMYFAPGEFDTVIMGDIMEHLPDPYIATSAAARVTRRALCLTIWEEWRLPKFGRSVVAGLQMEEDVAHDKGYANGMEMYRAEHPGCEPESNEGSPHRPHIWQFSDEMVDSLVHRVAGENGMTIVFYQKVPEVMHEMHLAHNWLVYLVKEGRDGETNAQEAPQQVTIETDWRGSQAAGDEREVPCLVQSARV